MKRKDVKGRLEAARNQAVPATEDAYHAVVERVGPLVHSTADHLGPLAHSAADKVAPYASAAAEKVQDAVQPWRDYAAHQASYVQGRAAGAVDKAQPYVRKAQPYVHDTVERIAPLAHSAQAKGTAAATAALGVIGPRIDDALERVPPAVAAARQKFNDDVLPWAQATASELAASASASPLGQEVQRRGAATLAALRGELELPPPPRKRKSRWFAGLAVVGAVTAAGVVVARKLLAPGDSGWQSARPTADGGWTPTTTTATGTAADVAAADTTGPGVAAGITTADTTTTADVATADTTTADVATADTTTADVAASDITTAGVIQTDVFEAAYPTGTEAESGDRSDVLAGDEFTEEGPLEEGVVDNPNPFRYGEGSFVGSEPPEGYLIKGNERSMKYHTPDSPAWERTHSEVWFNSVEAAERGGFVRAQR